LGAWSDVQPLIGMSTESMRQMPPKVMPNGIDGLKGCVIEMIIHWILIDKTPGIQMWIPGP
jgi:hypothetical protein